MEPNLIISLGSLIGLLSVFYTWHKDSRKNSEQMADLKARVNFLEQKAINTDNTLQELLTSIQEIKVAIAKIDTKISQNSNN
jgi:chromosome segregation ATPase